MQTFDRPSDYIDAAREMATAGRPALPRLLAEEAADRTSNPQDKARILAEFPGHSLRAGGLTPMSVYRSLPQPHSDRARAGRHLLRRPGPRDAHPPPAPPRAAAFSADYHDRSAAELAARTHRCKA